MGGLVVGSAENKASSASIELGLGLSLAMSDRDRAPLSSQLEMALWKLFLSLSFVLSVFPISPPSYTILLERVLETKTY